RLSLPPRRVHDRRRYGAAIHAERLRSPHCDRGDHEARSVAGERRAAGCGRVAARRRRGDPRALAPRGRRVVGRTGLMRVGILIPTRGIVIESARRPAVEECWAMARHADQAGYDSGGDGDSIAAKPRLEALTTLAYLAGITTRVRLGTAVLLPALRHPVVLAHQIANVDQISRGRVVLGLGMGWSLPSAEREWAACGADHKRRARRLE